MISSLLRLGMYGGLLLCIFSELFTRGITSKSLALVVVLVAMMLLLLRVGGNDVCFMLLLAFTARRFRFRDLLQIGILITTVSALIVVGAFATGLIGQTYEGARGRGSLGFGWVTFLSHYYLMIAVGYTVLRGKIISNAEIIVMLIIDCAIFLLTGARNSFVLALAFLLIVFIAKHANHWSAGRISRAVSALAFPACAAISWVLYATINPNTLSGMSLNSFLTGRIALSQQALDLYGVNLFGNAVQWVTQSNIRSGLYSASQYLYVDCSYLNVLINYGLVVFFALIAALSAVAFKATRRSGFVLGAAFLVFAVHGIVDPQLLDLHYCTFLLLLGGVFDSSVAWDERMLGLAASSEAADGAVLQPPPADAAAC